MSCKVLVQYLKWGEGEGLVVLRASGIFEFNLGPLFRESSQHLMDPSFFTHAFSKAAFKLKYLTIRVSACAILFDLYSSQQQYR